MHLTSFAYSKKKFSVTTLYRKSYLYIPRNEIARPRSPIPAFTVSVSDLFIPKIGLPIWLQRNKADRTWECITLTDRYVNVEIGRQNIIILFWK
jgi:hypothetical protein